MSVTIQNLTVKLNISNSHEPVQDNWTGELIWCAPIDISNMSFETLFCEFIRVSSTRKQR